MTALHTNVRPPRQKRRGVNRGDGFQAAFPFLVPAFIAYGIFVILPMAGSVRQSLFEWNGFALSPEIFVGIDNYVRIFTQDPVFWTAFSNSVVWVILSLLIPTTLGLLLAMAINRPLWGRNFFRSMIYVPAILAPIAIANVWRWMYNPTFGVFHGIFDGLGLDELANTAWLGSPELALFAVFAAFVWQIAGLNMILFLAGLQSVPHELVEAARLDGANSWHVFRHVTLPALRPTLIVVIVTTIIHSIKVFDLIVGMTGGGPGQKTQVLALWSYTQSFQNHTFGMGNAIAVVLLTVTLVFVVPYLIWSLRGEES